MLPGPCSNHDGFGLSKKKTGKEVKDLGYLCLVMFCWNPFSGFRKVENDEQIFWRTMDGDFVYKSAYWSAQLMSAANKKLLHLHVL